MNSPETVISAFEKVLGRQASASERERLFRIRDALDLQDNDALWSIVFALQGYEGLYRRIPARIEQAAREVLASQKALMDEQAKVAVTHALAKLSDAVAESSARVISSQARATRFLAWGWVLCGLVIFGALCVYVGSVLSTGVAPTWAPAGQHQGVLLGLAAGMARTPAGWIVAVGASVCAVAALWRQPDQVLAGRRPGLVVSAVGLIVLAVGALAAVGVA